MQSIIFTVIIVFFALLGFANLISAVSRWVSSGSSLAGCTLVVEAGEDVEHAEAILTHAAELLDCDPRMRPLRLAVICSEGSPAREIAERFCNDRGIAIATAWREIER